MQERTLQQLSETQIDQRTEMPFHHTCYRVGLKDKFPYLWCG